MCAEGPGSLTELRQSCMSTSISQIDSHNYAESTESQSTDIAYQEPLDQVETLYQQNT